MPGGTFGGAPFEIVIAEGKRGRVTDTEGRTYIDFLLGSGPMLLGHAHPDVTAAVAAQLTKGTTFFLNNEPGIRLAAAIVDAVHAAAEHRFEEIAEWFETLARAEKSHAGRFQQGLESL